MYMYTLNVVNVIFVNLLAFACSKLPMVCCYLTNLLPLKICTIYYMCRSFPLPPPKKICRYSSCHSEVAHIQCIVIKQVHYR